MVSPPDPFLREVVPLILVAVLEKNTSIKSAAESAILSLFKDPEQLKVCAYVISILRKFKFTLLCVAMVTTFSLSCSIVPCQC